MNRSNRIFVFATLLLVTPGAHADCVGFLQSTADQIHVYDAARFISTPESVSTIEIMNRKLSEILVHAEISNSLNAKIYRAIVPFIENTLTRGLSLELKRTPFQDDVFAFAYAFSKIVDFPVSFGNRIGDYADGFNFMNRWSDRSYLERIREFNRRFATSIPDFLASYSKVLVADVNSPYFSLTSPFLIGGEESPGEDFFFQYRYIFANGVLPLRALFQDRERGLLYAGVSLKPFAPYDGQHGGAVDFLNHDIFHAYVAKFMDQKVFTRLGVKTVAQARAVKALNNRLLQRRIREWRALPRGQMKDGIEALFYAFLHEQAWSYPLGVLTEIENPDRFPSYLDTVADGVQRGLLMRKIQVSLKGNERAALESAFIWLKTRTTADAAEFMNEFQAFAPR